jgi:hypothetical protein
MHRLRWQAIAHLTSGHKLMGGLALVAGIFVVFAHCFFESDRLLPQGIANVELFAVERCRAESDPDQKPKSRDTLATGSGACVRQQTSHELLDEIEDTKAYFRQFEHQGGTQWLPHGF